MDSLVIVGRYETVRLLGRGGMGEVYLARDPLIDRLVAVKLLADGFDAAARDRFTKEARAAGRLNHENIATIFDVGDHHGRPFIAMEYIPGETLAKLIGQAPPLATSAMLRLIEDACAGLAFAHNAGIVHLDVKPENLVRAANGRLKVLDFGIARLVETDETRTMHVMGTLRYMSPEQITGGPLDRRSDVFGLGCVLYEVIARRPAFGGTMSDIMSRVTGAGVVPLPELAPDVHPTLVRIVSRAMAPDPEHRYDNLDTLRRELVVVRRELETAGTYTTQATSAGFAIPAHAKTTRVTSRSWLWLVSGAVVAAFGAGLWLLPDQANQSPERSAPSVAAPTSIAPNGAAPAPAPPAQQEAPKSTETISNRSKPTQLSPRAPTTAKPQVEVSPPPAAGRSAELPAQEPPLDSARGMPPTSLGTGPPTSPGASQLPQPPVAEVPRKDVAAPPPEISPVAPAPEEGIRAALRAYEAAYAQRDLAALRGIYPNLPPAQAEAMGRTFAGADSYRVQIEVRDLQVTGSTATVSSAVTHILVPKIGNASRNTLPMRFELRQTGGVWRIERVDGAPKRSEGGK